MWLIGTSVRIAVSAAPPRRSAGDRGQPRSASRSLGELPEVETILFAIGPAARPHPRRRQRHRLRRTGRCREPECGKNSLRPLVTKGFATHYGFGHKGEPCTQPGRH